MSEDIAPAIDISQGTQPLSNEEGHQAAPVHDPPRNNELGATDRPPETRILFDEAAFTTSNSLMQQNGQGRLSEPSSSASRGNIRRLTIEKALLIDISADSEWVASIVEKSDTTSANKKFYLKMDRLYDRHSGRLGSTDFPIEKDITKDMPENMPSYFYFLSVSSKGKRIAVSFLPNEKSTFAPYCLTFQVLSQPGEIAKIEPENNNPKLQGNATFISDNLLSVIKGSKIMVYDSNDTYKLIRWYNIDALRFSTRSIFGFESLDWDNTHLSSRISSFNQHPEDKLSQEDLPNVLLQLPEFMENNVMVSAYSGNVIRVWSLANGCRLTSFKSSTPEVPLAISDGRDFIATFSKSKSLVNIYHMKTGLVSNTLETKLGNDLCIESHPEEQMALCSRSKEKKDLCIKHHLHHQMVYAQFWDHNKLLFLIQIRPLKESVLGDNALITFEGWDITAEKPLIQHQENIKVNWKVKNSYVKPFVIEKRENNQLLYTAVYTTLLDDDSCEFKSLDFDIFKRRCASGGESSFTYNWIPLSASEARSSDEGHGFQDVICFRLGKNQNVVLRIGQEITQLWQVSNQESTNGLTPQDRLVYICAPKPPHSKNPFDYTDRMKLAMVRRIIQKIGLSRRSMGTEQQTGNPPNPDSIDHWDSLGIAFHDNALENMLSIGVQTRNEVRAKIYLPLEYLEPESVRVCIEYHYVESAIRALHLLSKSKGETTLLYEKTWDLVTRCVYQMKEKKSRYFTTTSGSSSLALLASFEDGRDILFRIVQDEEIAISLFSYVFENGQTEDAFKLENRHENALTNLIEFRDFALYNLLLNRVLFHAQNLGVGCYSAVIDLIVFLQSRGDTDILKSTCRKMQFLHIKEDALSIVDDEIMTRHGISTKVLHKNLNISFTNLKPKATNEQIPTFDKCLRDSLLSTWGTAFEKLSLFWSYLLQGARLWYARHRYNSREDIRSFMHKRPVRKELLGICGVPYVYLCSYDIYKEDKENIGGYWNRDDNTMYWKFLDFLHKKLRVGQNSESMQALSGSLVVIRVQQQDGSFLSTLQQQHGSFLSTLQQQHGSFLSTLQQRINLLRSSLQKRIEKLLQSKKLTYKKESLLVHLALNQHENDLFSQKGTILETLLYFKWKKQIKYRFFIVCFVHAIYYVSFSVGVLFAYEVFDYAIGTPMTGNVKHVFTVTLMLASCSLLWFQEARQFYKMGFSCLKYFISFYNWVDLVALTLPIINLWQMRTDRSGLDELSAITTIVLWLHGVLRLRAIAFFGVTVETIIQLIKSVYKTLIIMLIVIFAFTNAFIVLLARRDDAYFQEKYSGAMVSNNLDSSTESTVNYNDDSSSNNFKSIFKAFYTLWLFIYGVWDPINDGDAGDNYMIMVLAFLFSFLTVLLFFNLVIALMSSRAEEVKALGKNVWLRHFAEVIAEIEQLWCFKFERVSRENNPSFIYYTAKGTDIERQIGLLEEDSNELVKKLRSRTEKREKRKGRSSPFDSSIS